MVSDEKLFDQLHYLNILMDLFAVLHGYIGPLAVLINESIGLCNLLHHSQGQGNLTTLL